MHFLSYAQNFEDVILRRVFPDISAGTYVDAGAWEPVIESVTKTFYDLGWQGINIEPSPVFERLALARPRDINLNIALGAVRGRMMLRVYRHAATVLQASTLIHSNVPRISKQDELHATDIEVEVLPLADVLEAHLPGRHIHFLKIDVEGVEEDVIRGADWRRHRPEVLLIEATRPQSTERSDGAWTPLILAAGYQPVLFDGLNAWFLREESRDRAKCFATPPNVFDNFHRYDPVAEQRIAAAEARAAEAHAAYGALQSTSATAAKLAPTGVSRLARWFTPASSKAPHASVSAPLFIRALYLACLGREPEPTGIAGWLPQMALPDGAITVARDIASSPEARARREALAQDVMVDADLAQQALAILGRRPRIVDLGAQILSNTPHCYEALRSVTPLDIIGFDPLAHRIAQRLAMEGDAGDHLTLLPYAIADGANHTLYINNNDATSSLYPLNDAHNAAFDDLQMLRTLRVETVQTHRLDDVLPAEPVDFLKLDIQGSEAMALRHGVETLARTAVIQCEVAFAPIYRGQPLFSEIHDLLAAQGFELVDLLHPARYDYRDAAGARHGDRLLWAEAVFSRVDGDAGMLAAQALIAAVIYGKPSLARHKLRGALALLR